MSKICPLFSSSSGNTTYIETKNGAILVDVGVSLRSLCQAISEMNLNMNKISAVCITHEHSDHIKGLKALLKKYPVQLVASHDTLATLEERQIIPIDARVTEIGNDTIDISGIGVTRFNTSHDCEGSSGYSFALPDGRFSVCTDTGVITDSIRKAIRGSDAILIESNHDIQMLKNGPYPPILKTRILSDRGHISNAACAAELPGLLESGTKCFILGHLSLKNNTPLLAESTSVAALMDAGASKTDCRLTVASPDNNRMVII